MKLEQQPDLILKRYEEAVKDYCVYSCWLNNERGRNYLEVTAGQIEKLKRLDARRKGAEEILGLDRDYIEQIEREAKDKAERVLALGMM